MMENKNYVIIGIIALTAVAAGLYGFSGEKSPENTGETTDWRQIEIMDVNSGENYSISQLEKPVLVETFAVWCPTCTRQQQEVKKYHEQSGISSVSLDVDPNEDASKIKQHTERNGFDWKYSIAPAGMTRSLIDEYGNSIAQPPLAPMILVCENGTRRLPNGVKPVSKLEQEVKKGC